MRVDLVSWHAGPGFLNHAELQFSHHSLSCRGRKQNRRRKWPMIWLSLLVSVCALLATRSLGGHPDDTLRHVHVACQIIPGTARCRGGPGSPRYWRRGVINSFGPRPSVTFIGYYFGKSEGTPYGLPVDFGMVCVWFSYVLL